MAQWTDPGAYKESLLVRKIFNTVMLVLLCYSAFSLACLMAIIMAPVGVATKKQGYASNIVHAMDCLMAAVLGWDGKNTVSAECGADRHGLCKTICALLDIFDTGHCARLAKR